MKPCEEMVSRLLSRRDRYIAEQKRRKAFIARAAAGGTALTAMLALGLMLTKTPPAQTESAPVETTPLRSQPTISLDLSMGDSPHIDALYERGYKTVDELLGVTELIVRATPVSVDFESAVGRCWILRVEEAAGNVPRPSGWHSSRTNFCWRRGRRSFWRCSLITPTAATISPAAGTGCSARAKTALIRPNTPKSIRLY